MVYCKYRVYYILVKPHRNAQNGTLPPWGTSLMPLRTLGECDVDCVTMKGEVREQTNRQQTNKLMEHPSNNYYINILLKMYVSSHNCIELYHLHKYEVTHFLLWMLWRGRQSHMNMCLGLGTCNGPE